VALREKDAAAELSGLASKLQAAELARAEATGHEKVGAVTG